MKPIMLVGVVLIVLGALALAYQGITYTSREKVLDLGPSRPQSTSKRRFHSRPSSAPARSRPAWSCP